MVEASNIQSGSAIRSDAQRHQLYAQRLETLNEVGRELSTATTEQEVFNIVAKAIQDVLLTDRVSYVIPNFEKRDCRISLLTGNAAIPQSTVLPLDGSSIELVIDSQAPICFHDQPVSLPRKDGIHVNDACRPCHVRCKETGPKQLPNLSPQHVHRIT